MKQYHAEVWNNCVGVFSARTWADAKDQIDDWIYALAHEGKGPKDFPTTGQITVLVRCKHIHRSWSKSLDMVQEN